MNPRTIRITGEAKKKYRPDRILVAVSYEDVFDNYQTAMEVAAGYTTIVKQQAASAGVNPDLVKTSYFNVSPKSVSEKDAKGVYRNRFVGYQVTVRYAIRIPVDNKLLANLLYALRKYAEGINFSYILEDRDKSNDEVLELAVSNATKKANLLAKASGQTLGELLNIDYSYGEIHMGYYGKNYDCDMGCSTECGSAPNIEIDPEDLEVSDNVTMIWELK